MKEVRVSNMPDHLYEQLLERAEKQRRSVNAEIIALLEKGVQVDTSERLGVQELLAEARKLRQQFHAPTPMLDRTPVVFKDWS